MWEGLRRREMLIVLPEVNSRRSHRDLVKGHCRVREKGQGNSEWLVWVPRAPS